MAQACDGQDANHVFMSLGYGAAFKPVDHKVAMWTTLAILFFPPFIRKHLLTLGLAIAHISFLLFLPLIVRLESSTMFQIRFCHPLERPWST